MADNNSRSRVIYENGELGNVKIADEVIACIAGLAATEVEGVQSMAGNVTNDLLAKLGAKSLNKGVKLDIQGSELDINVTLNIKYGYSIPKVSAAVQDKVKTAVENMTGLSVTGVSVSVAGISAPAAVK